MTGEGSLYILDVGHGNSTVVVQGATAVVVDLGLGAGLLQFLREKGVEKIETVIVSHADADHLGGLVGLLASAEVSVDRVYLNADGMQHSDLWQDVAYELDALAASGRIVTTVGLQRGTPIFCSLAGWSIEVLAPRQRLVHMGVGGVDRNGRQITTNTISAVVRILRDSVPLVVCPGDLDQLGYEHLSDQAAAPDMRAQVLLLPHHGGHGGSAEQTRVLTASLVRDVAPMRIMVSHGRRRHANPLRLVVEAARSAARPGARLSCTQMSKHCLAGSTDLGLPRVSPHVSSGAEPGISCTGTAEILPDGRMTTDSEHQTMIAEHAPARLCAW